MTRPADPLEARAREIASEFGIDPDSRIPMPDSHRTRPAWTDYREAARAEKHSAKEAADLALFNKPQPEQYRNSPLTIVGDHDENTVKQMHNCMTVGRVVAGALCADGHLGYAQPVGAVIAYEGQISISGVGFDIACGNMAVRLDTRYDDIAYQAPAILGDIKRTISFGVGRSNDEKVEHALFDDDEAWKTSGMEDYRQKARSQLGTVGGGNHYVDLFRDAEGYVWIGVHFGSRGFGHTTATRYLKMAGGVDGIHVPPTVVDENSSIGEAYLAGMHLAGQYAYAGREWVVDRVRRIIGGSVTQSVHNHHNFAWREKHRGVDCWVVRKGATPAWAGQKGFIGGSMGDDAVIVEGVENNLSTGLLSSTVHGAGRNFGRKQALRTFTRNQMDDWLKSAGVIVSGGNLDESPMAYKRLPEVLAHHGGTIRVLHTLKPFAVAMAGSDEFDPWKD